MLTSLIEGFRERSRLPTGELCRVSADTTSLREPRPTPLPPHPTVLHGHIPERGASRGHSPGPRTKREHRQRRLRREAVDVRQRRLPQGCRSGPARRFLRETLGGAPRIDRARSGSCHHRPESTDAEVDSSFVDAPPRHRGPAGRSDIDELLLDLPPDRSVTDELENGSVRENRDDEAWRLVGLSHESQQETWMARDSRLPRTQRRQGLPGIKRRCLRTRDLDRLFNPWPRRHHHSATNTHLSPSAPSSRLRTAAELAALRYLSDRNKRQETPNQMPTAVSQTAAAPKVLPLDEAL